jgi:hypothetical protein
MTDAEINQLIIDNLADFSNITPDKVRAVNFALLALISTMPKTKVLTLESIPNIDRNYSVDTLLEDFHVITGVYAMLECKVAEHGFSVGDTVTAPTPYPLDSGRTDSQGIGLQYTNQNNATVKAIVNDGVWIMKPYSEVANALGDPVNISPTIHKWKLKIVLTYL